MSRPTGNTGSGYKVTTHTISVQQIVRDAEGAMWDAPYYIYQFRDGERKFVIYNPYDWTSNQ